MIDPTEDILGYLDDQKLIALPEKPLPQDSLYNAHVALLEALKARDAVPVPVDVLPVPEPVEPERGPVAFKGANGIIVKQVGGTVIIGYQPPPPEAELLPMEYMGDGVWTGSMDGAAKSTDFLQDATVTREIVAHLDWDDGDLTDGPSIFAFDAESDPESSPSGPYIEIDVREFVDQFDGCHHSLIEKQAGDPVTYHFAVQGLSGDEGVGVHTLLDGTVHTDTVAQGASRGSLIYGNATPKWDEFTIPSTGASDGLITGIALAGWDATDVTSYRLSDGTETPADGTAAVTFGKTGSKITGTVAIADIAPASIMQITQWIRCTQDSSGKTYLSGDDDMRGRLLTIKMVAAADTVANAKTMPWADGGFTDYIAFGDDYDSTGSPGDYAIGSISGTATGFLRLYMEEDTGKLYVQVENWDVSDNEFQALVHVIASEKKIAADKTI